VVELDEHRMSDGETTWLFEGQRGQVWVIVWQPDRAEDNLRVWPCDRRGRPGRTHMWLHAATYADARATAERIAVLLANPCPAGFSGDP
jgi:hypothetical protein